LEKRLEKLLVKLVKWCLFGYFFAVYMTVFKRMYILYIILL
jgi:hypothetical protein